MKKLNFLETVGLVSLVFPVALGATVGVLMLTGQVKVYREHN
jgi:hypothetical protein